MKVSKTEKQKVVEPVVEKVSIPASQKIDGVWVPLPSRGVSYDGKTPNGKILLRPPKVKDVKFLAQITAENFTEVFESSLTAVLELLILDPKIDPWDLTNGDRMYLLLWVRTQIHPFYHMAVTCPYCMFPDKNYSYPLSNIAGRMLTDKYKGQVERKLSKLGPVVTLGLVTGRDECEVDQLAELKKYDRRVLRAAAAIKLVDGKPMSLEDKYGWLGELPGGDELEVKSWLYGIEHGPDYDNCSYKCSKCKGESRIRIPFRPELWYPSVPVDRDLGDAVDGGAVQSGGNLPGDVGSGTDGDR